MTTDRQRLACVLLIAVAIGSFAWLRLPFLSLPLERDEGEYAYIAQRMAAGDVPYRDAFDQKPPAIFLAYRLAFGVFGESVEGIHATLYVWSALTACVLFACVRRLAGALAAAFALLVFAVISIDPRITATAANTEAFMLLPLVGSLYCLVRALEVDRTRWWVACGALAAAACWFKQVAAAQVAFVVVAALLGRPVTARAQRLRAAAVRLAALAAGALAVSAPIVAWFALAGALREFFDAVFIHNLEYSQSVPVSLGFRLLAGRLLEQLPSFGAVWCLAAIAVFWRGAMTWRSRWLLVGFAISSGAGVATGLYFRPHYFVQLLPALAALGGVALAAVARRALGSNALVAWGGVAGLAALVVTPPLVAHRDLLFGASPTEISRALYGINPFPEAVRIGEHIRQNSEAGDEIYVIGSEPEIFFYAGRASATRYIFFYPLTGTYPDALSRQEEVIERVGRRRPLYVVWVNVGSSIAVGEESEKWIFQSGARWLGRRYELEFVAKPHPEGGLRAFEFVHGEPAQALLGAIDGQMAENPWVAVFRRAR